MRTRLLNLMLLAALGLAVSRLWLFLGEPPPSLPAITSGATPPAAVTTEGEQKAEAPEVRPESYDVIVARDLFSPTRGVVPPAPISAIQPPPVSKPQPAPKLTLYGVVIIDEEKSAYLIEGSQEGRPRKVRENESFANGVVKAIRPDGVTFVFAGSEINVPLRTPKEGPGLPSPNRPETVTAAPRPQGTVPFPRRITPTGVQPGQMPAPGRAINIPAGIRPALPPAEPGGEVFGEEEFQEGSLSEGEVPDMTEEDAGE